MFTVLFILFQFTLAEDLIFEEYGNKFHRIQNGECVYMRDGKSVKHDFTSTQLTEVVFDSDNCTGTSTSTTLPLTEVKYVYMNCPEYVGYIVEDDKRNCPHKQNAEKMYYKSGCSAYGNAGSINHVVELVNETEHLKTYTYKVANCTGDAVIEDVGACETCQMEQIGSYFVHCGSILKMILFIVGLLLFLL